MTSSACLEDIDSYTESTGCVPESEQHGCTRPLADAWIPESLLERASKVFSERYGRPVDADETALLLGRIRAITECAVRNGGEGWE